MKNTSKLLFLLVIITLTTSCDPPHYINFINNSNSAAKVKLNLNTKIKNYDLGKIATQDSIVFNLKLNDTANINFGIGDWSDNEIEILTKSIKSIEIETREIKTIYKTESSIKDLLSKNRHGFGFKTVIKIGIK